MTRSPSPYGKDHLSRNKQIGISAVHSHLPMLINKTVDQPMSNDALSSKGGDPSYQLKEMVSIVSSKNFPGSLIGKQSLATDRSLTIDELSKLHETMRISMNMIPTNEQNPYRPRLSMPMSAEKRKLRRDLAKESSRLSYSGKKVNPKAKFDSETVQQITIGNSETRIAESKLDFQF